MRIFFLVADVSSPLTIFPVFMRMLPSLNPASSPYSFSNPWLVNFSVRLFSVTVRTT